MDNKIFKTALENKGNYEIRILPNINDLKNHILPYKTFFTNYKWFNNFICYALVNGEIKILSCGTTLQRKFTNSIYDLKKGLYLDVNISEERGFCKVLSEVKEKEEYKFENNQVYLFDLYNTIKHIKLEDVRFKEMYLRSGQECKVDGFKSINMIDVYKSEYPGFTEYYTTCQRRDKIGKIKSLWKEKVV